MGTYLEDPDEEQKSLLSFLFKQWCERAQSLHHMFEIIESHESHEIRELVIKHLKDSFPEDQQHEIIELWITHPIPMLREFITELIDTLDISTPLKAAAYVMLDDMDHLSKIDPDFRNLDIYLKDLDPLLGSLLFQRVAQLKNPDLVDQKFSYHEDNEQLTLTDLIRRRDFSTLWENILDYPLPFTVQLMQTLNEEDWEPVDDSGRELYEILLEQLGTRGWSAVNHIKWIAVSKKVDGKFVPLTPVDISRGEMKFDISLDIVSRPDRIQSQKFQSRGRFNLTDPELGIHIYMEMVRYSEFDGMIHIPIYSINGVELAEFSIPATNENNFSMDEDGLYFTVHNKQGIFSVDIDAVASILLPVSRHPEGVNEVIPILLERANQDQKMVLEGLNLLSTLHRGREFSLWDLKEKKEWDDGSLDELTGKSCQCTTAFDIGNTTTKVTQVVSGSCDHEIRTWEVPTIVYYHTPDDYIIGNKVLEENLENTSQTFRNIKASLRLGNRAHLRIHNQIITAYDAYEHFINGLLNSIEADLGRKIVSVGFTYPLHAPSGFEAWLRGILKVRGYKRLEIIDELSATLIASFRLENQRDNVLLIDIGSSQMGAAVARLDMSKSRKRTEETRMREEFDEYPEIVTRLSIKRGSRDISYLLYELSGLDVDFGDIEDQLDETKHILARDFETEFKTDNHSTLFSLNNLDEDDMINVHQGVENSEVFQAFKLMIRNILVKSSQRGLPKDKINTVLLTGGGIMWPMFLKYLTEVFDKQDLILESDPFLTSKGIGLLANGQTLKYKLEQDYLLKTAKNGIVGYSPILRRGEEIIGNSKLFEIRPNSWMDRMVLDCWTRLPKFVLDEEILPLKDDEEQQHRRAHDKIFTYDRVFREIVDLERDSNLKVMVSKRGTLYFEVGKDDNYKRINTDTTVL